MDEDFLLCSNLQVYMKKLDNWCGQELFQEKCRLLIADEYRHYPEECKSLPLASLKEDWFIGMADASPLFRDATFRLCTSVGFVPKIAFDTNDYLFKLRMIADGQAVAILPECCIETAQTLYPNIRVFDISDADTTRSILLLRRNRALMSEAAVDFWNYVMEYYRIKDAMLE